jgi:hypothetical protein
VNGKRPGGWVALACRYFRDPRFDDVSADAELLWCHALAYCGEQETDGHVGRGQLAGLSHRLNGPPAHAAAELVAAGLWTATGRGYAFPRWADWQSTAEQKQTARGRAAERKRVLRESRGDNRGDRGGSPGGSPSASRVVTGAGVGHSPTTPAPLAATLRSATGAPNGQTDWEEYTDNAGNLYVRPSTEERQ